MYLKEARRGLALFSPLASKSNTSISGTKNTNPILAISHQTIITTWH